MFPAFAALAVASVIAIPAPKGEAPSKQTSIFITGVAFGEVDPNGKVPTVNGVPGAGTPNWDIPLPVAALSVGHSYATMLTFQDVGYTGHCDADVRITQIQGGKKVLVGNLAMFNGACEPGTYLVSTVPGGIPNAPGPVTVTAIMHFDGGKTSIKLPMLIQ